MIRKLLKPFSLATTALLSACQSAPPPVPVATVPHIQAAVPDVADVTYLARDMLPGRKRSAATIYGSLPSATGGGLSPVASTLGGGAIAAAAGQSPVSAGGVGTAVYAGTGLALAGALLDSSSSDNPHNWVSGAYLPGEVEGLVLSSADAARRFVRGEAQRGLDAFAQQTGRTVTCVDQCESYFPTYELRKSGGPAFAFFDPPALYVSLYIRPLKDASTLVNDVRDKVVGFHVAWTTVGWNDFGVCLNDHPPTLLRTDTYLGETVKIYDCNAAEAHPLERLLLRSLTAGGHTYIGAYGNGFFAWRGRVFALGEREPKSLIKYEIAPETDLSKAE